MKHGGQPYESQVCKNPDCERMRTANGFCMKHGGQPYESKVYKNPDCEGSRTDNGYCMEHEGVVTKRVRKES
jgi:hypothetical protein